MHINPFIILFVLYLASNFATAIIGSVNNGVYLEGVFFEVKAASFAWAFVTQLIILTLIYISFVVFFPVARKSPVLALDSRWAYPLLLLQLAFMLFNIRYGVNVAGDGSTLEGGSLIGYLFILLQPDVVFILVSVSLLSNKLFFLNILVFLFSMFLRGWMGGVYIAIIILLVRFYPVRLSLKNTCIYGFMLLSVLAVLPIIISAKWSMRSGASISEFAALIPQLILSVSYVDAFGYLLNRFQHVGHVAVIFENADELSKGLSMGSFSSYWLDGNPQLLVMKLLGIEVYRLNSYMVEFFFGIVSPTWSTNPGLAGWLFILQERFVFLVAYFFLVVVWPFYFVAKYAGLKLFIVLACFALLYLFHGWFGAYFNLMLYSIVIVLFNRVSVRRSIR